MIKSFLSLSGVIFVMAWAKIPEFAKDSSTISGNILTTVCSATGPSIEIARRIAINSCQQTAADFLAKDVKFKSLIVQSETDAALHSESTYSLVAKNVLCRPIKEDIQENDGFFQIYLKCNFDLDKIKTVPLLEKTDSKSSTAIQILDSKKSISISTIPKCDDILITGSASRILRCKTNPMIVIVEKDDQKILLRKKNMRPIEKSISDLLTASSDTFNFIFEH